MKRNSGSNHIEDLITDLAYLKHEAEAMGTLIEDFPYDEAPAGKKSILQILKLMDYVQEKYMKPIIEALQQGRGEAEESIEAIERQFEEELENQSASDGEENIQLVLISLSKHRGQLVQTIKSLPNDKWHETVTIEDKDRTFKAIVEEMTRYERSQLREIAEQIQLYGEQKKTQRKIEERQKQRNNN